MVKFTSLKQKIKSKLNYMELNRVQNTPCDFNTRSFFSETAFRGAKTKLRRPPKHKNSILHARASIFYLAQQEGSVLNSNASTQRLVTLLTRPTGGKKQKSKKKITI